MTFVVCALIAIGAASTSAVRGISGLDGFITVLGVAYLGAAVAIELKKRKDSR